MPTYDYRCKACGHELELFHSMTEAPKKRCPRCGKNQLERRIGTGAGFVFKGSGFYTTDYRSKDYERAAKSEQPSATSETKPSGDAKPAEAKASDAKSSDAKGATTPKSSEPKPTGSSSSKKRSKGSGD